MYLLVARFTQAPESLYSQPSEPPLRLMCFVLYEPEAQYRKNISPKQGTGCLQNIQRGPLGIVPFFLVLGRAKCNNSSFILESISQHIPHYWTPRNFTKIKSP